MSVKDTRTVVVVGKEKVVEKEKEMAVVEVAMEGVVEVMLLGSPPDGSPSIYLSPPLGRVSDHLKHNLFCSGRTRAPASLV